MATELTCGICRQIYVWPVDTRCRHTFCRKCLQQWLAVGSDGSCRHTKCPECRQSMINIYITMDEWDNNTDLMVIGPNVAVYRNRKVAAIVAKLDIKCDFEWNGCPEVMTFEWLDTHLKTCDHWMCSVCSLSDRTIDGNHDCIEVLKDRHIMNTQTIRQLKASLKTSMDNTLQMEMKCQRYKELFEAFDLKFNAMNISDNLLNKLVTHLIIGPEDVDKPLFETSLSITPDYIMIGNYGTNAHFITVTEEGIEITNNTTNDKTQDIWIPFNDMQCVEHFTTDSLTFLLSIQLNPKFMDQLQRCLGTDSQPNDPLELNIVIVMKEKTTDKFVLIMNRNYRRINIDCQFRPLDGLAGQALLIDALRHKHQLRRQKGCPYYGCY